MTVRKRIASLAGLIGVLVAGNSGVWAIEVNLSPDEAHKALEIGRIPMEKANSPEDVKKVLQQASLATRIAWKPLVAKRRRNRRSGRQTCACPRSSSRK